MVKQVENKSIKEEENNKAKTKKSWLLKGGLALLSVLLLIGGYYGYLYASTPDHIRRPAFDHYHFRTQIVVDGQAVDFSEEKFQEELSNSATSCSISINGTPIDFHDSEDQMTHIHWGGMIGGEFLKYFGWNLIGGEDDSLGRRYDLGMLNMHSVNIKGDVLPDIPEGANFYIYIGDEEGYQQKDWNDFLNMDLEDFFGKQSYIGGGDTSFNILDLLSVKAYAHGMVEDGHDEEPEADEAALERINNLIGNVVIFVQQDEPTDQQIQERFANLVPLHESTCGG